MLEKLNSIMDTDDVYKLKLFIEENKINYFQSTEAFSNPGYISLEHLLYQSCKKGKYFISKYLIEEKKINPNARLIPEEGVFHPLVNFGGKGGSVFNFAAESGNLELVKYLHEECLCEIDPSYPTEEDTALCLAAVEGHAPVVSYLLDNGANVNPKLSHSSLINCGIYSKKLDIVKLLVGAGTKIVQRSLALAIELGLMDIAQYLLSIQPGLKSHPYFGSYARLVVSSGNVALAKYLEEKESLCIVEYSPYEDSKHILLITGAKSGCKDMMRFLLIEKGLLSECLETDNSDYIFKILKEAVSFETLNTKEQLKQRIEMINDLTEILPLNKLTQKHNEKFKDEFLLLKNEYKKREERSSELAQLMTLAGTITPMSEVQKNLSSGVEPSNAGSNITNVNVNANSM